MVLADNFLTIHQQLRCSTHNAHVRLNRHPLLGQLTRPGLDLPTYTHLLTIYLDFYRSIEAVLHDYFAEGIDGFSYGERYKTDWLNQDLCSLGYSPAKHLGRERIFTRPQNTAQLVGMLYPLEGSTLGGQLISRRLQANLGLDAEKGGRFFHGYGADTAWRWTEFLAFAERSVQSPEQVAQACAVALAVFNRLEECLDGQA
ncbi:biliverdin-producing heme oxygenase [Marinobacter nauticus]|uniref:biliverdin-producing heme oxygenase n=1 Tax=Marinobacter nauticus TaxID=2743 RepID=UPI0024321A00|nr:biliverdin-producing heme oxygenase [Marinobacter nauticus]